MKYHLEFDIEFKKNTHSGLYIALEGIDGSGKTTQLLRLFNYFKKQGRDVIKTREPRKNDGLIGKLIQEILYGKVKIPPVAFQYLFTADREIHHEELVIPSLKSGKIVISDRCFWSAIPYGLVDRDDTLENGEQMLVAQSILSMYHGFIIPDYTFYLSVPLKTALERVVQDDGAMEIYENEKRIKKALQGYNWLLKKFSNEFIVIDARKPVEEVTLEIVNKLPRLPK